MGSESLGCGAYGSVKTCTQKSSGMEMAVKVVDKVRIDLPFFYLDMIRKDNGEIDVLQNKSGHSRARIMREVDTFRICAGQENIVQLIDVSDEENEEKEEERDNG